MNYSELLIASVLAVLMGLLLVQSLIVESPMKGLYVSFSLLMFVATLVGLLQIIKEIRQARKEADL